MQHGKIRKTSLDAGGGGEVLESTPCRQRAEPEHHIGSFPAYWPARLCDQRHRIGAGPTRHEVGSNSFCLIEGRVSTQLTFKFDNLYLAQNIYL